MMKLVIAIATVLASIQFAVGQESAEDCVIELNELFSPEGMLNKRVSDFQKFYTFGLDDCDLTLTMRKEHAETGALQISCIYRIHAVGLDTSAVVGEKQSLGGLGSRFQLKVRGRVPGHIFLTFLHSEKVNELNRPKSRSVLRVGRWEDPKTYPDLNRATQLLKMAILKIHAICPDSVKQENDKRLSRIYQEHIAENEPRSLVIEDEDIEEEVVEEVADEDIFDVVEEYPEFPGGQEKCFDYIDKNLQYPTLAKDARISGKVFVQFVVQKDGSITDARVIRGIQKDCDAEALRLVSSMPNWNPGRHRGQKVQVRVICPVKFSLE